MSEVIRFVGGKRLERRLFCKAMASNLLVSTWAVPRGAHSRPLTTQNNRQIRFVIPFAAGQGSDLLARSIAASLTKSWDQPVVVDNKPGANGGIAASEVSKAVGDGHTWLISSNSPIVINPNLYKKLAYDPSLDFHPIKLLGFADLAILVNVNVNAKSLEELIALLNSQPGKLSFGSPGVGSTSHMAAELLMQLTGTQMVHVPYKGSAQAMTDLIGGQIQVMVDALPSSLPMVRSGRVRILAMTGSRKSSFAPEVPTAASLGITGLPAGGWYGVFAPAQISLELKERMSNDLDHVMQATEMRQRLRDQFIEPAQPNTPASFSELVRNDLAFWEKTTRGLNLYRSA